MTYALCKSIGGCRNLLRKSVGENYVCLKPARFWGKPTTQFDGKREFSWPSKNPVGYSSNGWEEPGTADPTPSSDLGWRFAWLCNCNLTSCFSHSHLGPLDLRKELGSCWKKFRIFLSGQTRIVRNIYQCVGTEQKQSGRKLDATTHL